MQTSWTPFVCLLGLLWGVLGGLQAQERITMTDKKHSATTINIEQQNFLEQQLENLAAYEPDRTQGLIELPVKVHIVQNNNSSDIDIKAIQASFEQLDRYFLPIYVRFVPLGDYNYINKQELFEFDMDQETLLCGNNDEDQVINLYLVGSITKDGEQYCGYTYYPKGLERNIDRIILDQQCLSDKVSLARQLGHYLSLFPTAGLDLADISTQEFVDGSNCATAGDKICDTPADPGLKLNTVDERCGYIGRQQDLSGRKRFYKPDTRNLMADNPRLYCCQHFTPEQYKRMRYAVSHLRTYLEFPKRRYTKRQLRTLSEEKGIGGKVAVYMNQQPLNAVHHSNIYVAQEGPFSTGTRFNLAVTNDNKCYIYVLEGDTERGLSLRFPLQGDKQYFKGGEEKTFMVPSNQTYLKVDELKGEQGINHIIVLFSKKQLRIEQLLDQMNAIEEPLDAVQRLYSVMGHKIIPSTYLTYASEDIEVEGIATDQIVLPVIVEYQQQ